MDALVDVLSRLLTLLSKHHTLGSQPQAFVPTVLEAGKSEIKAPSDFMSGESPLPGSRFPHGGETAPWSFPLLTGAPIPSWRPSLMTSSHPTHLPKAPPYHHPGVRASAHRLGGTQTFSPGHIRNRLGTGWRRQELGTRVRSAPGKERGELKAETTPTFKAVRGGGGAAEETRRELAGVASIN